MADSSVSASACHIGGPILVNPGESRLEYGTAATAALIQLCHTDIAIDAVSVWGIGHKWLPSLCVRERELSLKTQAFTLPFLYLAGELEVSTKAI